MSRRVPLSVRVPEPMRAWYRDCRKPSRLVEAAMEHFRSALADDLHRRRWTHRVTAALDAGHRPAIRTRAAIRMAGQWWIPGHAPLDRTVEWVREAAELLWTYEAQGSPEPPPDAAREDVRSFAIAIKGDRVWLQLGGIGDWRVLHLDRPHAG